jgi:hypothetical protein
VSQCLVFIGNIDNQIWNDFCYNIRNVEIILSLCYFSIQIINKLMIKSSEISKTREENSLNGPYAGFDERDISSFNLDDEMYTDFIENNKKFKEEEEQIQSSILIWFFFLQHLLAVQNNVISDIITNKYRSKEVINNEIIDEYKSKLDLHYLLYHQLTDNGKEDRALYKAPNNEEIIIYCLMKISEDLLKLSCTCSEIEYLEIIKIISMINIHFPCNENKTTELSQLCFKLQYEDKLCNVSEGLLHIINEVGYPNHSNPESLSSLKLCNNLLNVVSEDNGFFYTNDIKILFDVIIRELLNIPFDENYSGENVIFDNIRCVYLQILIILFNVENWKDNEELKLYRVSDLDNCLSSLKLIHNSFMSHKLVNEAIVILNNLL